MRKTLSFGRCNSRNTTAIETRVSPLESSQSQFSNGETRVSIGVVLRELQPSNDHIVFLIFFTAFVLYLLFVVSECFAGELVCHCYRRGT